MTTTDPTGRANDLVAACRRKPLPVPAAGRDEILALLANDNVPLGQVARALLLEPALTFHVYRAAQERQRASGRERELYTIEQCLRLVGLGRVQQLVAQVPVLKTPSTPAEIRYLELLMQSRLAGLLGRQLATFLMSRQVDEVGLAAVLAGSPLWQLTLTAHEPLAECAKRSLAGERDVEPALFGDTLLALCQRLGVLEGLPALVQDSADAKLRPTLTDWARIGRHDAEAQRRWAQSPVAWLILAQHVALHLDFDPYSRQLDRALHLYAALQGSSEGKAWQDAHQAALDASTNLWSGALAPAAALLFLPPKHPVRAWIGQLPIAIPPKEDPPPAPPEPVPTPAPAARPAPKSTPAPAAKTPQAPPQPAGPRPFNPALVYQMLNVMKTATAGFSETVDVLNYITLTMNSAINLERVTVFAVTAKGARLTVAAHAGLPADSPLPGLSLEMTDAKLFGQLLQLNKPLVINPANANKVWSSIPMTVRKGIRSPQLLLLPLQVGSKSVALVMAEQPAAKPFSRQQFSACQELCQQAALTLAAMVRRRQQAQPQGAEDLKT